ncbi:MAG TPA: aminotransferase class I/II-fold pyridoxal phosphate-dependent enzyme [Verrucomicrobiae bacterium]|nr:aminotransferase class I/II-fold pyridoxal phosphate-dependent enzyme [Verrucomicrobiae bacterium]
MMKNNSLAKLAVAGGKPAFAEKLHVGRPNLGDRAQLLQRLNDILDRRWLTNSGCYLREFERQVATLTRTRHCVAMCNGESALQIAIRALGLKGEVIVPAFTFVATAHALQWQGITPVFADVDPVTHLIDPASVERLISERTTAILGVHLWGQPCPVRTLEKLAQTHRLKLFFDAAHAFGCSNEDGTVGGFGDAEVFSFHATKFVNSLEGGALVTNHDDLAQVARMMINFGFVGFDDVQHVGMNAKLNEFSAAMGLTSLESMDRFIARNQQNHRLYRELLGDVPGIRVLEYPLAARLNYQYVVIDADPQACPISRDRLLDVLWAENVIARRYFYPGVHRMEPYRTLFPDAAAALPNTERVSAGVLVLPTGESMTANEIEQVCEIIRLSVHHGSELMRILEDSPRRIHKEIGR